MNKQVNRTAAGGTSDAPIKQDKPCNKSNAISRDSDIANRCSERIRNLEETVAKLEKQHLIWKEVLDDPCLQHLRSLRRKSQRVVAPILLEDRLDELEFNTRDIRQIRSYTLSRIQNDFTMANGENAGLRKRARHI